MSSLDYLDLCRLCLVKDRVSVPIFEDEGDVRQIFLKITACLPVKVSREDKLPKKICDDCVYKVELFYQFWNTTANAEKQLLQWLGEVGGLEDNQSYVTEVLNSNVMKQERSSDSRLDGSVMQVGGHQNNMDIGMIDNMSLITMPTGNEQFTSVPMDTANAVQTVQAVAGSSTQTSHDQITQNQTAVTHLVEEEEESEDEENSDDGCDNEEGLPVKEETEEDPSEQPLEPTTFVNVSIPCDEAGPSGLQQQKISEISELTLPQTADGDSKTGFPQDSEVIRNLELIKDPESEVQKKEKTDPLAIFNVKDKSPPGDHQTVCLGYQCQLCSKYFKAKNLFDGHMIAHSDARPHQCDICLKSFKRTNTLSVHRRIHTRERNFVCDVCGRAFVQASQLTNHQRRHFDRYTRHCVLCNKGFFTNAELHSHMNSKHGAKEHVCDVCDKSLPNSHSLVRHTRSHDPNFQPIKHQCEFCGKTFAYRNSLVSHVKSHTGENKYDCHLCGKFVSSKGSLQDHLRLHGGEKSLTCDVCGKAFHKRTTLVVHKRTHTGEKPYICETCGKAFTQHSTLVIHRRYHTGQRPYQCSTCNKSFVSKALLNGHSKIHANFTV